MIVCGKCRCSHPSSASELKHAPECSWQGVPLYAREVHGALSCDPTVVVGPADPTAEAQGRAVLAFADTLRREIELAIGHCVTAYARALGVETPDAARRAG